MKIKNLDPIGLILLFVAGFAVIVVVLTSNDPKQSQVAQSSPKAAAIATREPTATLQPGETPVPTPEPAPQPTGVAAGDRIVIGKPKVNAPLSFKAAYVNEKENVCVMPNPSGAGDVAIYNFAACEGNYGGTPGIGGNTILAGHVDLASVEGCREIGKSAPCAAVFANIDTLSQGDTLELAIGGKTYRYQVTNSYSVGASDSYLWAEIVSQTKEEILTLITCEGDFNPRTREYTHRLVVVAKRIQ